MALQSPDRAPFHAGALTFVPILKERVRWGGRALEGYGKTLPADPNLRIGESWEISDVPGNASRVAQGPYAGWSLGDLVGAYPEAVLGNLAAAAMASGTPTFPLLVKLIDAARNLSIQVHPADRDLGRRGLPGNGKTEAWVILEAAPGAKVAHGLGPGMRSERLCRRVRRLGGRRLRSAEERRSFRWVQVKRGDVVFVPAGTVHAVGGGIVLLEIQQTSDITYRLYDWGRPGSQLHLRDALTVEAPRSLVRCPQASTSWPREGAGFVPLVECDKFRIEAARLESGRPEATGPSFHILACIDGEITCSSPGEEDLMIGSGLTVLLPAALGQYRLAPRGGAATVVRVMAG